MEEIKFKKPEKINELKLKIEHFFNVSNTQPDENFGWDAITNEDQSNKAHVTVQILEGYGIKPGNIIIDATEVASLKKIASGE